MKDLSGKIRTKAEVKVAVIEWAKDKESFTTTEAVEEISRRSSALVLVNHNRIAQYLRGSPEHEYHEGIKRWVKIRT